MSVIVEKRKWGGGHTPVPSQHRVHPSERADVAQEVEERDVLPPGQVIQDLFRVDVFLVGDKTPLGVLAGASEEAGDGLGEVDDVRGDAFPGCGRAFGRPTRGVTDEACCTANLEDLEKRKGIPELVIAWETRWMKTYDTQHPMSSQLEVQHGYKR
jgi:hypothetical protein